MRRPRTSGARKAKTTGKRKIPALHSRLRSAIRAVWMISPERAAAKAKAKVAPGRWQCAGCWKTVRDKEFQVDHVFAVGATPGSRNDVDGATWDQFITRMFHGSMQVLCLTCHNAKTAKGL